MSKENLERLSRISGGCTIGGLLLVTIWYLAYISGFICNIHGRWFGLSLHECSLLSYGGMGLLKILVLLLFFLPWFMLRMELRKHKP